ncbi:hypothetical protein BDF14DRAFT_1745752 [Spinellus fusiger]|nr:hypothetical protein BDF14DRAFT_1745752 [Spinellus fusiger]
MSYTPYTLQPILLSASVEESNKGLHVAPSSSSPAIPSVSPPLSFFGRRTTSPPPLDGQSRGNPPRINTILSSQTINTQLSGSFTIDSVEAWDTDLYLGTSDGHILHFILEAKGKIDQNTSVPYASRLERKINLGFGKKSVERILVLPQVSKAVVLCDSILSFYSLPFFDPIPISLIPHIKGVSCFSHDAAEEVHIGEDGTVELCVVKRRVVQVLKIGELVQLKKELPLPDGAIMITRYSCNLCLADAKFYRMIDLQQSTAISLCSTPRITPTTTASTYLGSPQLVARPVATVVKEDEFLVVSTMLPDHILYFYFSVLVNGAGDPLHGTIQWSSYPKALCVEIPYIAALLRNNTIEIHNVLDQQRLQVIYLDPSFEARGMSFGHGISVWMENLAIRLKRCPWPSQNSNIDLDSEIDLQNMLGREAARYSTVPARILVYGRDAVMAQLPTPLLLQVDELLDSSHVEEGIVMADHAFNSMSVDNSVYTERLRSEFDYIYQKAGLLLLQATVFDDAFALLSKGRMDPRVVISLFSNLIREEWLYESPRIIVFDTVKTILEQVGTIDDIVTSTIEKNYGIDIDHETASSANMRSALLKNAVDALLRYLLVERVRRHKTRMSDKAIDTTLLSVYIINEDSKAIFDFLRKPNKCCAEHSVDALISSKRYHALSVLYESKSMFKNVLDVWTKIYTGEYPDTTFTDSLGRIKHLLLQDINTHKLSLSDVMHYTWWLTDQNPTDGVEVFIRSPQYLVLERKSEFAEYHTRLACSYVHDVQEEMKTEMQQEQTHDDLGKRRRQIRV